MKKALLMLLAALLCVCVFGGVASADDEGGAWYYDVTGQFWSDGYRWIGTDLPKSAPSGAGEITDRIWEHFCVTFNHPIGGKSCHAALYSVKCTDGNSYTAYIIRTTFFWEDTVLPTCTTEGVQTKCCIDCHTSFGETRPVDPLGHKLTHHDAAEQTCTTDGNVEYWQCERKGCGKFFSDSEGKNELQTVTLGKLGHDFKRTYPHVNYLKSAATCTTPAEYYVSCSRDGCGASSEGTDQEKTFTSGTPLNHDLKGWFFNDETHWMECVREGCDYTEQEAKHTYGVGVVTEMPTCWSTGEVKYTCTVCDDSYTEELPALGHYFETVTIESTCTGEGFTAQKCIRCGLIVSQGVLDPAGHKAGDWEVTKPATCTEKGQEVRYCSVCGVVVEMRDIDALGHDWGEWETVKEPTTEEEGEEQRVCKRDASHVETRPIAKLEPTPTPAPTETPVPTEEPTVEPTAEPTVEPTAEPTVKPTAESTVKPTDSGESGSTDIPKTGDNSRTGYVYLMMALAAAGLCALAVTRRRESDN